MRMINAITTLVGNELERRCNNWGSWKDTLAAPNGSLYGIPESARRVAKFNPLDKSMTDIGPDFVTNGMNWDRGAITDNGVIYCPSLDRRHGILKIDIIPDDVTELNVNLLPEQGSFKRVSCAAGRSRWIYLLHAM